VLASKSWTKVFIEGVARFATPSIILCVLALFCTTGCVTVPQEPVAHLMTTMLPAAIKKLPSPSDLTNEDSSQSWGQEYFLGKEFAGRGDYYRAATCFHRSLLLLPPSSRHYPTIFHALILTYSLAGKYEEVTSLYEQCQDKLAVTDPLLALDCITLIYEAYSQQNRQKEAESLLEVIPKTEEAFRTLPVFQALMLNSENSFSEACTVSSGLSPEQKRDLKHLGTIYQKSKKHPETAAMLNALLPGAGYLYVREYQTATTAFVFNGLFIAATWQFFSAHQPAAAFISGGFEAGWYAGGIIGAHMAATTYNERLREQLSKEYLDKYKLFPLNQLHYQW
jgi:tetratricopeptide (TPR) repeat protein